MTDLLSHHSPRTASPRIRWCAVATTLLLASACGDRSVDGVAGPSSGLRSPSAPNLDLAAARADSIAKGYFQPRTLNQVGPQTSSLVSVVSVAPSWSQGFWQPNIIIAQLAGPVKSFSLSSGQIGDAILCSGDYGRVVAYDAVYNLLADTPLTLIDPSDCGSDLVTFGAAATVTSSSAEIASVWIMPMSPTSFPVLGYPGGRATATYVPQLAADPDPNEPPIARQQVVCYVATLACTFDASSSTDDHGIVSYKWDVGAGFAGKIAGKVITFTYPPGNVRMITLTVTDASGRSGTSSQPFFFTFVTSPGTNFGPSAAFTATCPTLTCTFDTSASSDDGGIVARSLNFGDGMGTGGNELAVRHTYTAPGVYNVSLVVYDGGGSGVQIVKNVTVGQVVGVDAPPKASFSWTCANQSLPRQCAFDASGSTDDIGIVSYKWDWGNGRSETKTGKTTRNTWASSGTYTVSLKVTDTKGQANTQLQSVVVP